jgi:hypothetical protein
MPAWFNYAAVTPLIETYVDDGSRDLCTGKIIIDNVGDFEVGLVGAPKAIELIRVATLNSDGNLTIEQQETVGKLVDHMLSVLRFTYNTQIDLVRFGGNVFSFGCADTGGKPNLAMKISEVLNQNFRVNGDNIRNVFLKSATIRPLMKLLSDTQNPALPLQYQFLSLYKAFELEFRVGKKWPGLRDALAPYDQGYRALKISDRSMENIFHELRDKCAHIKIGNSEDLGIIGLDGADAKKVASVLQLFKEAITQHISMKYPDLDLKFAPPPKS